MSEGFSQRSANPKIEERLNQAVEEDDDERSVEELPVLGVKRHPNEDPHDAHGRDTEEEEARDDHHL